MCQKLWLGGLGGSLSLSAKTPLSVPSCYRSSCAIYKFTKTSAILGTCFPGNTLYLLYAIEITCILSSAAALPAFPRDDAMQRLHACVVKICALVLKSSSAQSKVSIGSTDAFQVLAPFPMHAMKCHVTLYIDTTWKCREPLSCALCYKTPRRAKYYSAATVAPMHFFFFYFRACPLAVL